MIDTLIHYDKELFFYLNSLGNPTWDGFWLWVTHKFSWIPFYVLLLFLVFKKLGWKAGVLTMVVVAGMIATTDQLANFFKFTVERLRPCQDGVFDEAIRFVAPYCGKYGYLSGHASSSMALAVYIGLLLKHHYPKLIFIMLCYTILVSYSRIYVGVHYPLDIISGMVMGAIIGFVYYNIQRFFQTQFKLIPTA